MGTEEDAFWAAIGDDHSADGPRLRYADWCGENGLPHMEAVLRWCVATGRHPGLSILVGSRFWKAEPVLILAWSDGILAPAPVVATANAHASLPPRLYECLPGKGRVWSYYPTLQEAYRSLAAAWGRATRRPTWWQRRLGREAWVPSYKPVACGFCRPPLPKGGSSTAPPRNPADPRPAVRPRVEQR